jgi:hypothetical protein
MAPNQDDKNVYLKAVANCLLICLSVFQMTFNVSPIIGKSDHLIDTVCARWGVWGCAFCGKTVKIRQWGKHII